MPCEVLQHRIAYLVAETVVDLDERAEKLEHIVEKIIEKIQHKFGGSKEFSSSEED